MTEIAGTASASRNTVSRGSRMPATPDSPATATMPSDSDSRPEHLHHAELRAHLVVRPRLAVGIDARHDLGRHRVGDHVLDHGAEHDQHRAEARRAVAAAGTSSHCPAAPASVISPVAVQSAPIKM